MLWGFELSASDWVSEINGIIKEKNHRIWKIKSICVNLHMTFMFKLGKYNWDAKGKLKEARRPLFYQIIICLLQDSIQTSAKELFII